jgi:predicted DNA-binding transcriptional regulator AlpA
MAAGNRPFSGSVILFEALRLLLPVGGYSMSIPSETPALPEPPVPATEMLLSAKTCAAALEIAESTWWAWVSDPAFPVRPVRYGERFTRFRRSELSAWIASLSSVSAKPSPVRQPGMKALSRRGSMA